MRWSELMGDDRTRFCAHCNRHVHKLSSMSRREAEKVLDQAGNDICVALIASDDTSVTAGRSGASLMSRRQWLWIISLTVLSTIGGLIGVSHAQRAECPDRGAAAEGVNSSMPKKTDEEPHVFLGRGVVAPDTSEYSAPMPTPAMRPKEKARR